MGSLLLRMPSDLLAAVTAVEAFGGKMGESIMKSESQGEECVLPRKQSDTQIALSRSHGVAVLFVAALAAAVWCLVSTLPTDAQRLRIPADIEGLKELR